MKKIVTMVLSVTLLFACQKTDTLAPIQDDTYIAKIATALKDSLPANEYATLNFSNSQQTHVDSANLHLLRVPIVGKDIKNNFLVVKTDANGSIQKGMFISIKRDANLASTFNGYINYRSLNNSDVVTSAIINGHIQSASPVSTFGNNALLKEEAVQDLPEVIVYSSYGNDGGISYGDWYNLLAMLDGGGNGGGYYMPSSGGGGGSSSSTSPAVQVDFENAENKPAIDPKKYINCFGSIPDNGATCTITISTDIPVDGDPSKFFNWSTGSPGHTFVELYKSNGGSLISQNLGFYPTSGFKGSTGVDVPSKIADNAGHEYNARYTISVTPSQFQAALNAVQTYSSRDYNIATFNCTDFALAVFNAAGGNLNIPHYTILGYENGTAGSNTPEGLYDQLNTMGGNGNPNVNMPGIKGYGGTSHGPCN